ncbi:MAG: protein jag [Deltaproteobacteria bacterium]|nr:MAG: protein jag [Deltaproteobacteria bacterium]
MTDAIEKEGKSVENALEKASSDLGVAKEELIYEVLEETDRSFIGIGMGKKVKIRAMVKNPETVAETAKKTLSTILELMGVEAVVEVKEKMLMEDDIIHIFLEIIGDGSGLLIGKHGATLDAFQHLVNKITNRKFSGNCNIHVDTENYRKKREENLTQLAMRLSEKAKKTRKPVSLVPLSAKDRKTVHMALKEDKEIQTKSTGTGLLKRVVIIPSKNLSSQGTSN